MSDHIVIDISLLYAADGTAKLSRIDDYTAAARLLAGRGGDVILTGQGPIWLYLKIAHALHGVARRLVYDSPVTGEVLIPDHNPF